MYTITAQVINAFSVPASDKYPESWKLQLMGDTHTRDGQIKKEMITLSIPQGEFNKLKKSREYAMRDPNEKYYYRGTDTNTYSKLSDKKSFPGGAL